MSEGSVNPDLTKERKQASFNHQLLTHVIYGGLEKTRRRRYIENIALTDPAYDGPDIRFLSREDLFAEALRLNVHMIKKTKELKLDNEDFLHYRMAAMRTILDPLFLHRDAFTNSIRLMGSDEQKKKWLPLCENYNIIGCYCQTELGHGSNVQGLETTSTYDPASHEFVLHSPTLTSTKWWVGGLGKNATHGLVMAQLVAQGKRFGVHPFIVPIRSLTDHTPFKGITLGDVGPKFGVNEVDNGFMRMDHVRVPAENLLHKTGQVARDGAYIKAKSDKTVYSGMLAIRLTIPMNAAVNLAKAATIAIRYSCVRRQSEMQPGQAEPQVLDYQTQQHKVFPALSSAFAYRFVSQHLMQHGISGEMKLAEVHALSTGLKALVTSRTGEMIETCRLACGGHGYSQASGMAILYTGHIPLATVDGEITVLLLQTGRYLLKSYMDAQQGKDLDRTVTYLGVRNFDSVNFTNGIDMEALLRLYEFRASKLIAHTAGMIQQHLSNGKAQHEALGLSTVPLVQAAMAHMEAMIVQGFLHFIKAITADPAVMRVLDKLYKIYAINGILDDGGVYLQEQYMNVEHMDCLRDTLYTLYAELRPDAVACVDAFDIPDVCLGSILGRYDGQVYDNLYEWAKSSPLNKTEVHDSYYKHIQPFQKEIKSRL